MLHICWLNCIWVYCFCVCIFLRGRATLLCWHIAKELVHLALHLFTVSCRIWIIKRLNHALAAIWLSWLWCVRIGWC